MGSNKGAGFFITFEGGEGAGKSTQIAKLADALRARHHEVVVTREPGGTLGAEAVRSVILDGEAEPFGPEMEAVLFAAARADHIDKVIKPALEQCHVVLCDRYIDSTRVYQGTSGKVAKEFLTALESITIEDFVPDITFILDLPAEIGLTRAQKRRGIRDLADRFEKELPAVHEQRRQAFLEIARQEPQRCVVIDALQDVEAIGAQILAHVSHKMGLDVNG